MRLDHVEVEGFRGIDRLSLDLDDLTTIISEPEGGKTSLLHALGRVLDPHDPDEPPRFGAADFHRAAGDENPPTQTLSIVLGLQGRGGEEDPLDLPGLEDGGVSLRVVATRSDQGKPVTTVDVVDRAGIRMDAVDAPGLLTYLRRRHPAVVIGGPRRAADRAGPAPESAPSRLRALLKGVADPRSPLTWDALTDVRGDLLQAAGRLAEHVAPVPERRRTVREMTDVPRALVTDLSSALTDDAGEQRQLAALWLLLALLEAVPAAGLGETAEPILLFDDIEANLHPTWLAATCAIAFNLPFQLVVATYSPAVLTWVPLGSIRRLVRRAHGIEARSVHPGRYSDEELRRLTYHIRLNRGGAFFARCWILVEGETEAWLVPEFARLAGVELPVEGIRVIEFAQSGTEPLLKVADDLGIPWIVLADGDQAGHRYRNQVQAHLRREPGDGAVVMLPAADIERYLFDNGYAKVIKRAARSQGTRSAVKVIRAAVENESKPGLALQILAEADERGPDGVPAVFRELATTAKRLARGRSFAEQR